MHGLNVAVFIVGWVLFVALQIQNSVRSSSNGLQGIAGWLSWLKLHAIELLFRAFVSALLYGYIVNQVQEKIAAVGLTLTSTSIAGFGGLAANSLLYQFFGLIPWLRVETGEHAPPAPVDLPSVQRLVTPPPGPPAA